MAIRGRSIPIPAIVSRNSLADAPVLTTPRPVVVTAQPVIRPGRSTTGRNSLQDAPVLTTPAPVVVGTRPQPFRSAVILVRPQPADAVVETPAATPGPVVVTSRPRRFTSTTLVLRSPSLEDLATPPPVVVTSRPVRTVSTAIVVRSSLEDFATPGTPAPWVVTRPSKWLAPVLVIRRSTLVDPEPVPPNLAVGTAAPIVSQTPTGLITSTTRGGVIVSQTRGGLL